MSTELATVKLDPCVRDELRVIKAERGETYSETIEWLIDQADAKTKREA